MEKRYTTDGAIVYKTKEDEYYYKATGSVLTMLMQYEDSKHTFEGSSKVEAFKYDDHVILASSKKQAIEYLKTMIEIDSRKVKKVKLPDFILMNEQDEYLLCIDDFISSTWEGEAIWFQQGL